MARRSILQDEEEPRVDLSSMIDCIFILLIFFIVATVFVEEKGLQASKPDAAAASSEETETVVLQIAADNKVFLQDEEVRIPELAGRVQSSLAGPETPVVIRAHENSDHGVFVSVWDAARRGGAEMLSFSTVN